MNRVICEITQRHVPQDSRHNSCCKNVRSDKGIVHRWDKGVWLSTKHDVIFLGTSECVFRQSSPRICRSQRPRGLRRGSAATRLLGLRVRIPQGHGCLPLSLVSVVCCQVELSTSSWSLVQRCYTECGVSHSDREVSIMRRLWPTRGCCAMKKMALICSG